MEKFENRDAFVSIDAWVNKHLKFREIKILFDEPDGDADYEIPIMATWGYEVRDIMRHFLPWLDFEYHEEPDDSSGEVEGHLFSVQLSEAARIPFFRERSQAGIGAIASLKGLRCSSHSTGNGLSRLSICNSGGWRPSRIASTICGASSVSRRTRQT